MATLTEDERKRVEPLLKSIAAPRQRAAYQHLVASQTMSAVGAAFGYTRQDGNVICKAVLRWHATLQAVPQQPAPPAGWGHLEVLVARDRADEVRRLVAAMFPRPGGASGIQVSESENAWLTPETPRCRGIRPAWL